MRRLIIILLVLGGLLVVADYGAAAVAESAVSRQMRGELGLIDDPSVRINGFPFLTQAIAGTYSSIDVDATRIQYGSFKELEINARLHDVGAPLSMMLGSGPKSLEVSSAEGIVKINAADLQRLIPEAKKIRIESVDKTSLQQAVKNGADTSVASMSPEKTARLVGTVDFFGQSAEIAVLATLEIDKGKPSILPVDARLSSGKGLPVPGSVLRQILDLFRVPLITGDLPLDVTADTFQAKDGTLQISGTARNLTLD
jgi:LmeA-like phospholipid-binding